VAHSGGEAQDVAGVLADRLAATLVHHEPGWRLPRPSALARRYDVRPAQVEQAVRELAARHLIRQLPDGQLYRASPAEFLIPVQGVPRLGAHLDPMGSDVTCRNRKVSWRRVPEDIGWALGVPPNGSICAVKCHWSVNGEPAAISTTYLTQGAAASLADATQESPPTEFDLLRERVLDSVRDENALGVPAAMHLEMQPPPSSVARGLRLSAGQPAVMLTVRFDDLASGEPVALTVAALRADLFRIVIDSADETSAVSAVKPDAALGESTDGEGASRPGWAAVDEAVGQ
jgi:DNA-binding GntR family transcriptional regulator